MLLRTIRYSLVALSLSSSFTLSAQSEEGTSIGISGDQQLDLATLQALLKSSKSISVENSRGRNIAVRSILKSCISFNERYGNSVDVNAIYAAAALELNQAPDAVIAADNLKALKDSATEEQKAKITRVLVALNLKGWLDEDFAKLQRKIFPLLKVMRQKATQQDWHAAQNTGLDILALDHNEVEAKKLVADIDARFAAETAKAEQAAHDKNLTLFIGNWEGTTIPAGSDQGRIIKIAIEKTDDPTKPTITISDSYYGFVDHVNFQSRSDYSWDSRTGEVVVGGKRISNGDVKYNMADQKVGYIKIKSAEIPFDNGTLDLVLDINGQDLHLKFKILADGTLALDKFLPKFMAQFDSDSTTWKILENANEEIQFLKKAK